MLGLAIPLCPKIQVQSEEAMAPIQGATASAPQRKAVTVLILASARFLTKRRAVPVLTSNSQTNEPFRGLGRHPRGSEKPKDRKTIKDDMIGWFKSAPMGSHHPACYRRPGRSRTSLGKPKAVPPSPRLAIPLHHAGP